VNFNVTDNTAITPDDYSVANTDTFVTFPAGTATGTTQMVTINILDDMLIEATETLNITLAFDATPPAGMNMLDGAAVGTVTDNDGNNPTEGVAVADFTVNEDAGTAQFVISYTGNTVQDAFAVNFNVTDNTAITPDDYSVANTDTFVTFPAGTATGATQMVTINILDDMLIEATETLNITLAFDATPPAGMNMLDGAAVGTVTDNDGNEDWPENITIEACDVVPTAEDIISTSTCAITVVLVETIEGDTDSCPTEYTITRTWTITDCVGNTREHVQVITIEDTIAPTFVEALPADMTVACNEVPDSAILTASDSCESDVEVTFEEVTTNDENCATGYTITRTWTANDCAGNTVDHTQVITILPTGPITADSYEEEITILCGDEIPEVPVLTFTGGCGDYVSVFTEETQNSIGLSGDFMIIRIWDVTDVCGNTASFEQIVFVLQPQLQEVIIDICVEDELIDLINFLPEGFDTEGEFEVTVGNVAITGSLFDPANLELGEYKIAYTSAGGICKYYVDFTVIVNRDCVPCGIEEIEVSKAVTANGDGVNDMFEIKGTEYCDYTFDVMIFNRWGNMVYEAKNYRNDWGGYAPNNSVGNSSYLPTGTYYYLINVVGGDFKQLNGYIYLGAE
jgi:gliding motility-associated-like protein